MADDSPREKQPNQPQEVQCEAKPFALGDRTGVLMTSMPSEANTSSKLAVNFVSRSRIRNRNDRAVLGEISCEVAGHLGDKGAGRMIGDTEDVHHSALELDDEQHIELA